MECAAHMRFFHMERCNRLSSDERRFVLVPIGAHEKPWPLAHSESSATPPKFLAQNCKFDSALLFHQVFLSPRAEKFGPSASKTKIQKYAYLAMNSRVVAASRSSRIWKTRSTMVS